MRLDSEFGLPYGKLAAVEGEPLTVKFASVANDSRCPKDVQCVWAGNAEVLIDADANGARSTVKLHTHGGQEYPKSVQLQGYTVELVDLLPYPVLNRQTPAVEKSIKLIIRKGRG